MFRLRGCGRIGWWSASRKESRWRSSRWDLRDFALIDEDGIILPPAPDRFTLPVLTGVRATDAIESRRDRVHRMLRLTVDLGEHARNISEIDVSDRDNLKATIARDGHMVTLLLGDRDYTQRFQNFLNHYGEIKRRLPNLATLDLRLDDRITVVE